MAIATIASQQAITASPVSAATAAMIGLLAPHHIGLVQILIICVPSTLIAVFVASLVQLRVGKELKDDPEYQKRLASGEMESPGAAGREASAPLKAGAMTSALIFLAGVALVVLAGIFPELRTVPGTAKPLILSMPIAIAIVMLAVAAVILTVTKAPVADVPRCKTCQSGITAIIGILGLAWLGDTFISANRAAIIGGLSAMATAAPWTFAFGLFLASVLLYQAPPYLSKIQKPAGRRVVSANLGPRRYEGRSHRHQAGGPHAGEASLVAFYRLRADQPHERGEYRSHEPFVGPDAPRPGCVFRGHANGRHPR